MWSISTETENMGVMKDILWSLTLIYDWIQLPQIICKRKSHIHFPQTMTRMISSIDVHSPDVLIKLDNSDALGKKCIVKVSSLVLQAAIVPQLLSSDILI